MKNAVLINIPFYTYNDEIIASLKRKGYNVFHFSYKPENSSISKFRFKYSKAYQKRFIKRHVEFIQKQLKDIDVDVFIFINPTTFTSDDVNAIFKNHEKAKKILYLWDAVTTYPQVKNIFSCFDKIYSFDIVDCKEYGFKYRPTFASKELLEAKIENQPQEYDIFYIASYSKKRYGQLLQLLDICKENELRPFYHLYIKNKLAYLFFKLQNPKLKMKYVSTKLISNKEKLEIISKTRAIFDTPLDTQTGITMRVIEGMIMNKKIITTNKHIVDFDFYNDNDFFVFSDSLDKNKIRSECKYKINPDYYSADSLVEELTK